LLLSIKITKSRTSFDSVGTEKLSNISSPVFRETY
jgi:hypothetical protein